MRAVLAGCALFLSGAATALFVDHLVARHHRSPSLHTSPAAGAVAPSFREIDSALVLDSAQRVIVRAIFDRHQQSIDSAWGQINRGVMHTMDSVHVAMRGVLTREQLVRLHAFMLERHGWPARHPAPD